MRMVVRAATSPRSIEISPSKKFDRSCRDILRAVREPAPSGIMFADGIRLEGLKLLAKHHIAEGIDACVLYAQTQNPWGSEKRIVELMSVLKSYGVHARTVIPQLQELAERFEQGEPGFPKHLSLEKAAVVRDTIRAIETATEQPELIHIN